jgi:Domain of unknown function (DUF4193)
MSSNEFDDETDEELVDVPEEEAEELEVDDLAVDDDLDDDLAIDDDIEAEVDVEVDAVDVPVAAGKARGVETAEAADEASDDDDAMDLDEELHPDDVEEPLDVLLKERTASATLEDEEEDLEDEEVDVDERGDGPTKIVPRRPGEFLCSSCFLVLPRSQLADEKRMLCRDCA